MKRLVFRSLLITVLAAGLLLAGMSFLPEALVRHVQTGAVLYLSFFFRYLLIAGLAFAVFYSWKRESWLHRRIQQRFPETKVLQQEFRYSLSTFAVSTLIGVALHEAAGHGYTRVYTSIAPYGYGYFFFSIGLAIVIHDAYFYWTHRLMHWKPLFKVMHRVHHLSHNPSPWASFSFHPAEAVVEAGILPLLVFTLPMHPLAIMAFLLVMTAVNVLGHLGFELFPSGFTRHWLGRWHNTSTHHNMHHQYTRCNYGLYFNFWDQLMGTNHAAYEEQFERVAAVKQEQEQEPVQTLAERA